jgi:hypothetical protein
MTSKIESLKNEVNQLEGLSEGERSEILADLQFLEGSNKRLEKSVSESKKATQLGIASFVLGALVMVYLAYKVW